MHLLPLLVVVSISTAFAFPLEEEETPRSLSLMYSKRGRELFGKRSMPFELVTGQKRGRELFGKRSGSAPMSFTLQEKRKGRELFGKRSGSPPILSLEYENESSSEEEQRIMNAIEKNLRERRAKMTELLG
ncbi:hypothetical protein PRIPAC_79959 [Pristionchus pacificus]|uniref:Uncharacterized protein n=1 Tax=Pristionchus pacificus TaxID=54126 RepID=A0A2A6C4I3_PRIPA|nr:hypothetical protein PRIPAC_79959 [Pristionchus pacificus]|eukprot:PDM73049.1 hypothetical protein PRIPAC_39483 [Pristionchus pacificus]